MQSITPDHVIISMDSGPHKTVFRYRLERGKSLTGIYIPVQPIIYSVELAFEPKEKRRKMEIMPYKFACPGMKQLDYFAIGHIITAETEPVNISVELCTDGKAAALPLIFNVVDDYKYDDRDYVESASDATFRILPDCAIHAIV